jgi:hypothetical protein
MGKAKADDEETAKGSHLVCRGTEEGAEEIDRQNKLGNLSAQVEPDGEVISRPGGAESLG